jgi:hypothetical protein
MQSEYKRLRIKLNEGALVLAVLELRFGYKGSVKFVPPRSQIVCPLFRNLKCVKLYLLVQLYCSINLFKLSTILEYSY